jgi:hypothetical protein
MTLRRRLLLSRYVLESLWELTRFKLLILLRPFPRWSHRCGVFQCETLRQDVQAHESHIQSVRISLKWVARRVPWKSKCLDQALAAQHMLARRHLPTTLYLGMRKEENQCWGAHAWVRCGDRWVIGESPNVPYTVVGTYARMAS